MDNTQSLTLTNGDIWLATQPARPGQLAAFDAIGRAPMTVLAVRSASTLARAVNAALADIVIARDAALEQHCPIKKQDATGRTSYSVTPEFVAAEAELMAETITLQGVRAMKISEFSQGTFLAREDVELCGPLLID